MSIVLGAPARRQWRQRYARSEQSSSAARIWVLPNGDGRFGSYSWNGSTWELSPDPLESCLLQDGLPLDFSDPEVRLADMNGDGIQDIVKIRRGRVVWWPGRGEGVSRRKIRPRPNAE
jgi:hypothetical protein